MNRMLLVLFCFLVCALPTLAEMQALVGAISAGDELSCLYKDQAFRVRIKNVQCPKDNIEVQTAAMQALQMLVGRTVTIDVFGVDSGVQIGAVFLEKENLAVLLVKDGLAKYTNDFPDNLLYNLETYARANRVGLWKNICIVKIGRASCRERV